MRQILQNLKNGETNIVETPIPSNLNGNLLIQSNKTVVSVGTERMLIEFGKSSYWGKARQQPDKVKQVLDKVKTDGIVSTFESVKSKLEQPIPLGYCNAGVVINSLSKDFKVGERVISNGSHADFVRVPENLCAKIPDNVDDESAAFTVIGSIALQGVRLLNPTIGETVVVTGLGLIGLMAVQILKANGCRVLGIDYDAKKCSLAQGFGAETVNLGLNEDLLAYAKSFSRGNGIDAVLITASTDSSEPMSQAANMLRKRGRIVLVGVVGLELSRAELYEKEISFQVSCSYGPGRYDSNYEEEGNDYPIGFVRWTEQRNFEAILDMLANKTLNVKPLVTHRFEFKDAIQAYTHLNSSDSLGILLDYSDSASHSNGNEILLKENIPFQEGQDIVCGFLGAGNYASRILIPAFKQANVRLETIVTSGGLNSRIHGERNGFYIASTDEAAVLESESINTIIIATRHNLHADQVINALQKNKNVFVEKPLAITLDEIERIETTYNSFETKKPRLMVGFNRRFSPYVNKIKSLLANQSSPKIFVMTVNAGDIPKDHWTQDSEVGGGRIIGEACHFVDLLRFLAGSKIAEFKTVKIGDVPGIDTRNDKVSITLSFVDGSMGTIHYLSNGGQSFPKERLEVFCGGAVLQLNNFRELKGYGWKGFRKKRTLSQKKGQVECVDAFVKSISSGGDSPIPFEELLEVSRICIEISNEIDAN
ncbi:bi-domain-containing oxidoreductase [Gammaproteobacteria bacterium]|nr:bi-domain-containing oxidoreductase [Gammaproteobacteria bacterium]